MEEEGERGIAHIVEHLAFNATDAYSNHEIVKFLEKIGAQFGACQVGWGGACCSGVAALCSTLGLARCVVPDFFDFMPCETVWAPRGKFERALVWASCGIQC